MLWVLTRILPRPLRDPSTITKPGHEWSLDSSPLKAWKIMPLNGTGLESRPPPSSLSTTRFQTTFPVRRSSAESTEPLGVVAPT